jgi:methyl-accepting chemotaxis protein
VPFSRHLGQERSFSGVVTADICLGSLIQHISDVAVYDSGYAMIGIIGFSILFLVIIAISRYTTRPLHSLVASTREIARGNLKESPSWSRQGYWSG